MNRCQRCGGNIIAFEDYDVVEKKASVEHRCFQCSRSPSAAREWEQPKADLLRLHEYKTINGRAQ